MCLILIAWRQRKDFPVIIAANRDEFHARPSAPAGPWPQQPALFGGRDLEHGGTWLGISRGGRFAAVTNFREPGPPVVPSVSRGWLVQDFLLGKTTPVEYLHRVEQHADHYNGFSLLVGDTNSLAYFSNRGGALKPLEPGLYGLSNHLLDTPWPKVERGKAGLRRLLDEPAANEDAILDLLADCTGAPDPMLPDTGVGLEKERRLSPVFVHDPVHGTRCSTAVLIATEGRARFVEQSYDPDGKKTGIQRLDIEPLDR